MTPEEARRQLELMESIPPAGRNTPKDPFWVRAAIRYWRSMSERPEAARHLEDLERLFERFAEEGWYERRDR